MFQARAQPPLRRGPPHGLLLALVITAVVIAPYAIGDQGTAITEALAEALTPMGLLLLPIFLLLTIQYLSSPRGSSFVSSIFSSGQPDTFHRVSGSPVGVALVLVLVLFLLSTRVSLFGGQDSSE